MCDKVPPALLVLLIGQICFSTPQSTTSKDGVGLLVTTPSSWLTGTTEKVCVTSRVQVTSLKVMILIEVQEKEPVSTSEININFGETKCQDILVSKSWKSETLNVVVKASDPVTAYSFEKSGIVQINSDSPAMIFVQTDKPVYKPSDTVKIRTLAVQGQNLLPLGDQIDFAYVEDATKTRLMQWGNVSTQLGLGSLEMPLSSEPPFGMWTMKVMIGGEEGAVSFEVKEYVLPKFSVQVLSDANIYSYGDEFKWKVCAEYTYGEPVSGEVEAYACMQAYSWANEPLRCIININKTMTTKKLEKGCAEFTGSLTDLLGGDDPRYVYGRKVQLMAAVEEMGTGIKQNATKELPLVTEQYKVTMDNSPKFYKPGLVYYGKGEVKSTSSDEPAAYERVEIEVKSENTEHVQRINFTSVTDSEGSFVFNISEWFTRSLRRGQFSIKATVKEEEVMVKGEKIHRYTPAHYVSAWYSTSESYLVIKENEMSMKSCEIADEIIVMYRAKTELPNKARFFYQMTSHGDILTFGSIEVTPGAAEKFDDIFTYNIILSIEDSKSKRAILGNVDILVYYVREDGETIADSVTTSFDHCFTNKVKASFSEDKVQPGHEVSLDVRADPDSLCSLVVVDKSIQLMGAKYLHKSDILSMLKSRYDRATVRRKYVPYWENDGSCVPSGDDDKYDHFHPEPFMRGPLAGRPIVGERKKRSYMPHPRGSDFVDSQKPFEDMGLVVLTDLGLVTKPCQKRFPVYRLASGGMPGLPGMPGPGQEEVFFKGSPETEKQLYYSPPVSRTPSDKKPTLHRTYFPETWLWDLKPVGPSGLLKLPVNIPHTITEWIGNGFCVNPNSGVGVASTFTVTAFQPFFMSFTLPYSMVRGEQVAVPISVFNYLSECLKVSLMVEKSKNYTVVNGTHKATLKVCGQETIVHTIYLIPNEIGKINFTVKASSSAPKSSSISMYTTAETNAEDIVTRELLVEAEGKPEEISKSQFVCAPGGGEWEFELPTHIVEDSVRSQLSVIGDVMGPALSGLDSLLQMPMGCGEQNMLLFAPNIFVLQYLTKTQRLTSDIEKKALSFMQTGYQRELNYRHKDGSYSAFGESDKEGSIWLTAFVIKSFAQAKPYMFIDDKDLQVSIDWMVAAQQDSGCFPQIGRVLHKDMTGGVQGSDTTSLTAYILVSLLEAGLGKEDPVIKKGLECLHSKAADDTYTLALLAYAYAAIGEDSQASRDVNAKLEARAVNKDGAVHWEAKLSRDDDDSYHSPSSADVELTAYVLLSIIQDGDMSKVSKATPIVRWLSTQRNSYGGFASTQDTVLALQSLAQYAGMVFSDDVNLKVQMASNGEDFEFNINPDNSLLLQLRENLPQHERVHYSVEGNGCALVQASVRYNRLALEDDQLPSFILKVNVEGENEENKKCNERDIKICASYNASDESTNMAVVAVKMVSGWVPEKSSVEKLKNIVNLKLKRFDIDKNTLQLYFDEFDTTEKCFAVSVVQEQQVKDSKPALIHVYDYYNPSDKAFIQYSIETTCLTRGTRSRGSEPQLSSVLVDPKKENKGRKNDNKKKEKKKKEKKGGKCPACDVSLADTSAVETLCGANFIYKVEVKNKNRLKVQEVIRFGVKDVPPTNGSIFKYRLSSQCQCDSLEIGTQVVISTNKKLKKKGTKWILKLKKESVITSADFDFTMNCPVYN